MQLEKVTELLFGWWQKNRRDLPWRHGQPPRNPYHIVLSEVMLQQTQVERVLPKFFHWRERWPTLDDLAVASLTEVLIEWQGLGYNRRARQLWMLAKNLRDELHGEWPTTENELIKLPGLGRYTTRALMVFGFGKQVGMVDTNVRRIFQRVFDQVLATEKEAFQFADGVLPKKRADEWHQMLMDFGALVCRAKAPKCAGCPIAQCCAVNLQAQREGFATYAEKLEQQKNLSSSSLVKKNKGKDAGLRFEQTDRYFRGRIIDELRRGSQSQESLKMTVMNTHGLNDSERLERLLQQLAKEGMIVLRENQLSLADQ